MTDKIFSPGRTPGILSFTARIAISSCFYYAFGRYRLVDLDEGFYLMAARLVLEGKNLYGDFFFTQMPLTPLVYALWITIAGSTWMAARVLPALLFILAGLPHIISIALHREKAPSITLDSVMSLTAKTLEYTEPGDLVISKWPGYLWATDLAPWPGLENQFALQVSGRVERK